MMFRSLLRQFGGLKAIKCDYIRVLSHHHSTLVRATRIFVPSSVCFQHNFEISSRHKSKKGPKQPQSPSESETEEDKDDFEEQLDKTDKATKIMNVNLKSLRVDALLKAGLGLARNKIESSFYDSKIRINGQKLLKKSEEAKEGDEVDLVKCVSPMNPDFLIVARVEVLSVREKGETLNVKLRRCKSLTIDNYDRNSN